MDLEMLHEVTPMLQQQMEKTQLDRNYVQLERDTIQNFYDISRQDVKDMEMKIKDKDREMEIKEENHRTEVRVYMQKVKHLEYEHKNNVKRVSVDAMTRVDGESTLHGTRESDLKISKRSLKLELKEKELSNEEEIENMSHAHDKNLSKLREEFNKNLIFCTNKCENGILELSDDLEIRRKVDIHEIEERKNLHINDLMKNHEKAFTQIKNYYNDITQDNVKLIKSLKDEILGMKTKAVDNSTLMFDISQENKRLSEPLSAALKEVERLKYELKDDSKDKLSLKNAKSRHLLVTKQLKELKSTHETSLQDYSRVENERNDIYETFEHTVHTVQRKGELKNLRLEQRLSTLSEIFTRKQTQLQEVLQAAHLDPTEVARLNTALESLLENKNASIKNLKYKVARSSKAYNDTLQVLFVKLQNMGIPEDDFHSMGFVPLLNKTSSGPADLVAR